ncbi:MAG: hypothetical protein SFX73_01100 [Kofleriaceae bacterium]|nr:hypothetical protein [Kofleriaceae bacterium]
MRVALPWLVVVAACGSETGLPVDPQCNPLGINACMTPWPSSAFEADDPSTATGRRLALPERTLPVNVDGLATDPTEWNLADGFSPSAPMVISFPTSVDPTHLPPFDNMDLSLAANSPTVLIDLTTGQRIPHFAEVDAQAESTPGSQALLIRPAARLVSGHRYAVAITDRLTAPDGEPLPVPPGFAALRDGRHTDHELLEEMRPRFDEVLDLLEGAGFPADELVVAWDFTVASDAFIHRDMLAARDRAVAAMMNRPFAYTITSDGPHDDGMQIRRKIVGTFEAPLFLTNNGTFQAGTVIARDSDGLPALQGFYRVPFTATIPACAYTASAPVPMVMYGHGLLGESAEVQYGVQRQTAAELCMVFVGTDLRGMSSQDLPAVARTLNEISKGGEVFEVLEQGIVNHVALAQAMRTTFAEALFVDGTKPLVDPTRVYYYGLSQGAIFGTAVMAYEPTITRAVLGVGGANYSVMLDRSTDWPTYRTILSGAYPDALDVTLAISLFQMRWDKTEGSGVAHIVRAGTPTHVPPKQLLVQIAIGDDQVPNIASYWQARTMDLPVLGPTPTTPWGLTVADSPLPTDSALIIMDGGAPAVPSSNIPAPETGMHNLTRNQPAARRQIGEFFATGSIVNACTGPCTCAAGACD